ncbi:MAG: type II toxin-antitoxin system RelE/ParE family toxin [Polyangiaceae bacterium]
MAHTENAVEVVGTDEFSDWFGNLDHAGQDAVARSVDVLAAKGLALGYPQSSAIAGVSFALRELRIQSSGRPLRVFYAFDPRRQAVLLFGGDKTGEKKFYERMIRECHRLWREYLKEIQRGTP